MTADDSPNDAQAPGSAAASSAESGEATPLGVEGTVEELGNQLKPDSPVENLKSNVPMPGDSLFTKVMKIITSWT